MCILPRPSVSDLVRIRFLKITSGLMQHACNSPADLTERSHQPPSHQPPKAELITARDQLSGPTGVTSTRRA